LIGKGTEVPWIGIMKPTATMNMTKTSKPQLKRYKNEHTSAKWTCELQRMAQQLAQYQPGENKQTMF
jgi:hypothetical protein